MSLYRRGNVWWAYFYVDGIRHQYSTGTANRRQAETIERKLRDEANAGRFQLLQVNPNVRFGELAARFLANTGSKPFHVGRLNSLLPYFADQVAIRMTKGMVQDYRAERLREKPSLTDATLNRDAAVLRHILYWAVEEGLLLSNPLARLRLVHERSKRRMVLRLSEEAALLEVAPKHLKLMILIALYAGLRRGEIFQQVWEDVDLDRKLLYATRSKTPQGEAREIPIAETLFKALQPIRSSSGLVVTYRKHGVGDYKTAWHSAVQKSLKRAFRFHDLRHTFNTRLMEAGVIQDVRKALMGHSSGKEINSVYTHVELPVKREAIARLESWVADQKPRISEQEQDTDLKGEADLNVRTTETRSPV